MISCRCGDLPPFARTHTCGAHLRSTPVEHERARAARPARPAPAPFPRCASAATYTAGALQTKIPREGASFSLTGGRHKARGLNPALPPPCFICSAPCFYPAAGLSSLLLVKEQLHSFGPLKATGRSVWLLVTMSLMPLF
ncbi:hypothetical protein HJG60_012149 [Phyllostomus discolor]|uniref:Uncharacterized protein n=1 Tax=Phyllostomus discolor TaxID=89673 RepID=A0A834DYT5_9CHIR|nr:hypothetical protein HJG60_012149 [Phyllostomus discolor]